MSPLCAKPLLRLLSTIKPINFINFALPLWSQKLQSIEMAYKFNGETEYGNNWKINDWKQWTRANGWSRLMTNGLFHLYSIKEKWKTTWVLSLWRFNKSIAALQTNVCSDRLHFTFDSDVERWKIWKSRKLLHNKKISTSFASIHSALLAQDHGALRFFDTQYCRNELRI